jgi:hypothetical protein
VRQVSRVRKAYKELKVFRVLQDLLAPRDFKEFKAQLVHLLTLRVLLQQPAIYLQAVMFQVMHLLYRLMVTSISGQVHHGRAEASLLVIPAHAASKVCKAIQAS